MVTETGPIEAAVRPDSDVFLELGTNRLARDLFLLVAVYALFIIMFMSTAFRITMERTWTREGRAVETAADAASGPMISIHLRRDGRIVVGGRSVATPAAAAALVKDLMRKEPALRQARVLLNVYHQTPSIGTSNLTRSLAEVGLDPDRFSLRFTQE